MNSRDYPRRLKMPNSDRPARLCRALLSTERSAAAGFVTVALTASALFPARQAEQLPSLCPFHHFTGRDCPGCGMSRAFILISHGQIRRAYRMNKMSIPVYALSLYLAVAGLSDMLRFLRSAQPRSAT